MDQQNVRDIASLQLIYGEICTAHHGIADFRAKLLARLPILSDAGLFAILFSDNTRADAIIA